MKKIVLSAVVFVFALICILSFKPRTNAEFLRVHIRANSNSDEDQSVKYIVKNAVVEYLTPILAQCESKEESMSAVRSHLSEISLVATKTLRANGKIYTARAKLCQEEFPTRNYGDVTLASGVYDALIVELGSGEGDNWWCVVYPPLCFVGNESNGSNSIVYKSKIAEIIKEWLNSK